MKHTKELTIIFTGISICLWGFGMGIAQDAPPEYAGTRECRDCHRDVARPFADSAHALTLVELNEDTAEDEDNPIAGDFSVDSDNRLITFPGESDPRAFDIDDVAYTLGAGRHVQAYLYETEPGVYHVLPAQWDTVNETWVPLELAAEWPAEEYEFGPNCAGCHVQELNTQAYEWSEDGVMCETCHGPGLDHVLAADDAGGSIDEEELALIYDSINIAVDPQTCGQCHSRGLAADGIHPYPTDYYPGETLTDVFTPFDPDNAAAWHASGHASLPNMQYNETTVSAHPNGLASAQESDNFDATCLGCHSSAQIRITSLLNKDDIDPETVDPLAVVEDHPYGVTCVSCHNPHLSVEEGETAPAANLRAESYTLCTSCHYDSSATDTLHHPVQQVFEGTALIDGIDGVPGAHFTADDGPLCATCHMPQVSTYNGERQSHTFQILAPQDAPEDGMVQGSCTTCHEEGAVALQALIDDIQVDTRQRVETARGAVDADGPQWVIRTLDAIEGDGSAGIHNYAYTDQLLDAVEAELNLDETEEAPTS